MTGTILGDAYQRIAQIAATIRDYYKQANDGLPTIATPDALHLATAIYFSCSVFYTFDEHNDHKRKVRAIIPLSPLVAGQYPLIIKKPAPEQLELGL